MEIRTIGRSHNKKVDKIKAKELLEAMRKEHSPMVKGKFEFVDAGSGFIEFNYRIFPEDLLVAYKFVHNEICEIPMGLVKHLNNTVKKIRRFGLESDTTRGSELPDRGVPSTFECTSRIRFIPENVL